jgi:hypothetical protein
MTLLAIASSATSGKLTCMIVLMTGSAVREVGIFEFSEIPIGMAHRAFHDRVTPLQRILCLRVIKTPLRNTQFLPTCGRMALRAIGSVRSLVTIFVTIRTAAMRNVTEAQELRITMAQRSVILLWVTSRAGDGRMFSLQSETGFAVCEASLIPVPRCVT